MYQWGQDEFVYLQRWKEFSGFDKPAPLVSFDESGQVRTLYPTDRDRFVAGPGVAVSTAIESRIEFQRDSAGKIVSLTWQREGAASRLARRVDIERREDVGFSNGEVRLAGTLISPDTSGKHPAIILVHGSGAQDREQELPFARFLIRRGVAVLGYDKRGVGESTGDWNAASFDDLAGDVVAAFEYLKTRRDIDARQIGLLGISQAGWIMPLAAVRAKGMAFLISISGAGISAAETTIDQAQNEMTMTGMPRPDVDQIVGLMKLQYQFVRTGQGWDEYAATREKLAARMGPPPEDVFPGTRDHPHLQFIKRLVPLRSCADTTSAPGPDARHLGGVGQQHHGGQEQGGLGGGAESRRQPGLHAANSPQGEPRSVRGEGWKQRGNAITAWIRPGVLHDDPRVVGKTPQGSVGGGVGPGQATGGVRPLSQFNIRASRPLSTPATFHHLCCDSGPEQDQRCRFRYGCTDHVAG